MGELVKHETSKGNEMQASHRGGKRPIITHQPSEVRHPGEGARISPAPRQQDKTAFGFGQVDDLQLDAMLFILLSRRLADVALIDKGAGQARKQEQAVTDRYKLPGGLYHCGCSQGDGYRMHQTSPGAESLATWPQKPDCGQAI